MEAGENDEQSARSDYLGLVVNGSILRVFIA